MAVWITDGAEAVDVLMWAMAGWIAVFAAAVTLLVLAVCAAVAWVWRALPALTVRVRRPRRRPAPLAIHRTAHRRSCARSEPPPPT